jgi:hypothetical protein
MAYCIRLRQPEIEKRLRTELAGRSRSLFADWIGERGIPPRLLGARNRAR